MSVMTVHDAVATERTTKYHYILDHPIGAYPVRIGWWLQTGSISSDHAKLSLPACYPTGATNRRIC